jgi:hypothetical protein
MKGSRVFTKTAAGRIRVLLAQTRAAERAQQKILRQKIRDIGFYISDFGGPADGFTPDSFDELVRAGTIRITE